MDLRQPQRWSFVIAALVLAFALATGERVHAQGRKLNGELRTAYLTQVGGFAVGGNGRIVYQNGSNGLHSTQIFGGAQVPLFESDTQLRGEALTPDGTVAVWHDSDGLYAGPSDGSGPGVLLASLPGSTTITSFTLSLDGQWVVYLQQSSYGLYSVPIDGSQPPALLTTHPLRAFTLGYAIAADSAHVLFLDHKNLFTIPIQGGTPTRLHPTLLGSRQVQQFELSSDGERVVFTLDLDTLLHFELYSTPVDGSGPLVKLSVPLLPDGNVSYAPTRPFSITPDSAHVTYAAHLDGDQIDALYSVPIQGGPSVVLDPGTAAQRAVLENALSPDGTRVVYRKTSNSIDYELWSVPLDASQPPVRLTDSFGAGERLAGDFQIDRASARVVFRTETLVSGYFVGRRLFTAPIDGSSPAVELTPPFGSSQGVPAGKFALGAERVAFLADVTTPGALALWSAPLDGSVPAFRLHDELVPGGDVSEFVLNAPGFRAIYRAEQAIEGLVELFVVPLDGSLVPALRSDNRNAISTTGDVASFRCTADGSKAVYFASQESGTDLFAVNLVGTPQPVALGAQALANVGSTYFLTPDGSRVVFYDNVDDHLFSAPLDGSGGSEISGNFGRSLSSFQISPNSSRVVQMRKTDFYDNDPDVIFSTPVAGGTSVELNTPRALSGALSNVQISPDSSRVVYVGVQETAGVVELFSAPLSGDSAPVKLNDTLAPGGDVGMLFSFLFNVPQITGDSTRVVYVADRNANDLYGLYSAPIAGGSAPMELAVQPSAGSLLWDVQVSPDSTRAVYRAEVGDLESFDLFSVPVDGSGPPVELSALPGPDRDVSSFAISPDSTRVVYGSDQDADEHFELYSVALAGGSPPVRLTFDAGPIGGIVDPLAISPDSSQVVYSVTTGTQVDLFSVPIAGGAPPVSLNGSLPVSMSVSSNPLAEIDATGHWVLFRAEANAPGQRELYAVPLNGSHAPRSVAGPLAGNSATTMPGSFAPGANSVVYLAEQDEAGVFELFIDELLPTRPDHHRPR
jgi:Tol biopolymer transport system component